MNKFIFLILFFCSICLNAQDSFSEDAFLKKIEKEKNDTSKIDLLLKLSEKIRDRNSDKGLEYAYKALALSRKVKDQKRIIDGKIKVGQALTYKGRYPEAQKIFIETLDSSTILNYRFGITSSFNRLGVCERNQGNFDKAINYYFKSLKMLEEDKDSSSIAKLLSSIGVVYYKKGDNNKAIEYYDKSIRLHKLIKNSENSLAAVLNNLAGALMAKKDYKRTKEIMLETFDVKKKTSDLEGLAAGYTNYVHLLVKLKEIDEAAVYAKRSREIAEQLNSDDSRAGAYSSSGEVAFQQKKYNEAINYYEKALEIYKRLNARDDIKSMYYDIGEVYDKQRNWEKALKYHVLYTKIKDSLFNKESEKVIAEMNSKYETEKKEMEIEKLNDQQKLDKLELSAANDQKQKQQTILFSVVAGLLLVIIFSVFIYNRFKITQKQKITIEIQKQKVDESYQLLNNKNAEILAQRDEIELQKNLIQETQKEIVDSITYAKRIQDAILPPVGLIKQKLPDTFVLYKPKDIVAGDFYWMEEINDCLLIAVADCTGHGVPGAIVSVICSNALNRAVKEFDLTEPGKILDKTRDMVLETFAKSTSDVKDGMDISLLCINKKNKTISWSGANNPLWYFLANTENLLEIKADKQPIGQTDHAKPFATHILKYEAGSSFYLFSDGLADQFGGPKGKKFKYKQLAEIITQNNKLPLELQSDLINSAFESWRGQLEQVDDVCILGIKL